MATSSIEWTDKTWNPITGCNKISAGCVNCYAEVMSRRLKGMRKQKYSNGFSVTLHESDLNEPMKWKTPQNIFVCSMSDLFHKDVPFAFIDQVLDIILKTPRHRYQILTKRADRMLEYFSARSVPVNAWIGVTVESVEYIDRIDKLRLIQAPIRFVSCEPLLSDLGQLNLDNIDWLIVGGESGSRARPMRPEWVLSLREQTIKNDTAFFFKQWGTWGYDGIKRNKKDNGKLLNGKICQQMPTKK